MKVAPLFTALTTVAGLALAALALDSSLPAPAQAGDIPPPFVLITANAAGSAANGASEDVALSADGRHLVFRSEATDLVPGAPSGTAGVFLRQLAGGAPIGAPRLVGVIWAGNQAHLPHDDVPAISGDGRVVAFRSVSGGVEGGAEGGSEQSGIFVSADADPLVQVDLAPGGGAPDGLSSAPALSADGRFVAFHSWAGNLVGGDDNRRPDVFVHDRVTGTTRLVSVATGGGGGGGGGRPARGTSVRPWLSADGQLVVFESDAPDLVPGDSNGRVDVFARDLARGVTERLSVATDGRQASRDSHDALVSADGRFVAFASDAGELSPSAAAGAPAIYLRDRTRGTTVQITVALDGEAWRDSADQPALSPDGCCVAFRSTSRRLVPGKTDDEVEIFVFDRRTARMARYRPARIDDDDLSPVTLARGGLAAGGRLLAFTTGRALVPVDRNTVADVYAVAGGLDARAWLPMAWR